MDMEHQHSMEGSTSSSSMTSMQMSFYWGKQATILFEGWHTTSVGSYVGSLLALLAIAFLYQYLEHLTSAASPLISHAAAAGRRPPLPAAATKSNSADDLTNSTPLTTKLLLTLLFGVRVGLAYLLMLAVMSFNAGVFIAIVLGFSAGFFVFRSDIHSPKSASISPASALDSRS